MNRNLIIYDSGIYLIVTLLILLFSQPIRAQNLNNTIDTYLSRLVPFGFNGAILIAKDDSIIINKGYGLAQSGIENSNNTVFGIESITKQFTATAILKLEMEGKLLTEDLISKYFDVPGDKADIKVHHLLTHTSGIISGTTEYFSDNSKDSIVSIALRSPLEFEIPGSRDQYSNIGYALLAAIIEKVSGVSYEKYVYNNLFIPAGLFHTGYRIPKWKPSNVAHYFSNNQDNGSKLDQPFPDWNFVGSGGMKTTTLDLFKWHLVLNGNSILSEAAKTKMYTPYANSYGYGWYIMDTPHGTLIEHDGGHSDGMGSQIERYPDSGYTIILFCNHDGERMLSGNRLVKNIRKLVWEEDLDLPPLVENHKSASKKINGSYSTEDKSDSLVITNRGKFFAFQFYGQQLIDDIILDSELSSYYYSRNTLTEEILKSLFNGNEDPFLNALAKESTASNSSLLRYTKSVSKSNDNTGMLKSYSILGTVPDWLYPITEKHSAMTFVRVEFENSSRLFRLHWNEVGLIAFGGGGLKEPLEIYVLEQSPNQYLGYHIPTGINVSLKLNFDNQKNIGINGNQSIILEEK